MKRIIRKRKLTAKQAKDNKSIIDKITVEFPPIANANNNWNRTRRALYLK